MKKNLTFLMLMLLALVSFTACSSDDDGDGLGNKDAGSENTDTSFRRTIICLKAHD